jgi:hypothetical protein
MTSKFGRNKGQQQDPTQIPQGIDVNTFFFPSIPIEVRSVVPVFHTVAAPFIQSISQVVMNYLCASSLDYSLPTDFYESLLRDNGALSTEDINALITATYIILRTALRNKVKVSVFRDHLQKMNVPSIVIESMVQQMQEQRASYESRVVHYRLTFPKLERVRWRVDVVISSGSLTRVMRPNILMQMITKDGRIVTFELTMEMFHQLRYSVAKVLHEMQTLERHPIIRIVNEFKRREEEDYNK